MLDEHRYCHIHGWTLFKFKKNKKSSWYVCHKCLKAQWRKDKKKSYSKNPEYTKSWQKQTQEIRRYFTLYLKMLLYISGNMPK